MNTQTNLELIEHLDFKHVQPCEVNGHAELHEDQPAMFLVTATCPGCGKGGGKRFICLSGWELYGVRGVGCGSCSRYWPRSQCAHILRVIGGAA